MKRESDRSGNAAMLHNQPIKRLDSLGIAQDDGYLPSFLPKFGLTPRPCFWGILELHALNPFRNSIASGIASQPDKGETVLTPFFAYVTRSTRNFPWLTLVDMLLSLFLLRQSSVALRIWKSAFISFLRVGPIPAMSLSYTVTSDVSTGICT